MFVLILVYSLSNVDVVLYDDYATCVYHEALQTNDYAFNRYIAEQTGAMLVKELQWSECKKVG